ncbi:uncharacterized protein ARMOST_19999 [Armillaria ostoyae]|uniref:Uncharacterized protein n=1 Tax=Armillaria ostoyae TaxID=47428 RepID=A0A284S634_ARMOS|nr:uncharacterized protein ARMOST_19999 [Armillaria ostoyae]
MTQGFKDAEKQQGSAANTEIDEVKQMLLEMNPWFLGLTSLVSVPHVLTIVTNVFVQIVILLYLIDNNENTSWMRRRPKSEKFF